MASVRFYLKQPKSKVETSMFLSLSFDGRRYKFYINESIHPRFWNADDQCARRSMPDYSEFNDTLQKKAADYLKAVRILKNLDAKINSRTISEKVNEFNGTITKDKKSFMNFIQDFIEDSEVRVKHGTIKSYKTTQAVLVRFQQHARRRIEFNSIDKNFHTEFERFQQKVLNYTKNTAGKNVKNIKVFMNAATDLGINNNMEYRKKSFKVGKEEIDNIYLSDAEIQKLYELDLDGKETLDHIRDTFILGCYTGLRFSDLSQIKKENINGDVISIRTEKTDELVSVPIHPLIKNIMSKYEGKYSNSLPPTYANQVMNRNLKILGEMAGLTEIVSFHRTKGGKKVETSCKKFELICTHTARRSFATNLYRQGMSSRSIMLVTGHRTERALFTYIKITPRENVDRLRQHWEEMERLRLTSKNESNQENKGNKNRK